MTRAANSLETCLFCFRIEVEPGVGVANAGDLHHDGGDEVAPCGGVKHSDEVGHLVVRDVDQRLVDHRDGEVVLVVVDHLVLDDDVGVLVVEDLLVDRGDDDGVEAGDEVVVDHLLMMKLQILVVGI